MTWILAEQNPTKVAVAESIDVEFATNYGTEQVEVIPMKEIEASISSIVIASGSADTVEIFYGIGGVIDGGEELEVTLTTGSHDLGEVFEAVNGLPH